MLQPRDWVSYPVKHNLYLVSLLKRITDAMIPCSIFNRVPNCEMIALDSVQIHFLQSLWILGNFDLRHMTMTSEENILSVVYERNKKTVASRMILIYKKQFWYWSCHSQRTGTYTDVGINAMIALSRWPQVLYKTIIIIFNMSQKSDDNRILNYIIGKWLT